MEETIARRFLYSIVRHVITVICGILIAKGWVDSDTGSKFTEWAASQITIGLALFGATLYMSYKDKIWEFLKTRIALLMPPSTSISTVAKVAATVEDKRAVAKGQLEYSDVLPESAQEKDRAGSK